MKSNRCCRFRLTPTDSFRVRLSKKLRVTGYRPWEPDSWPTIPGYTVKRVLGEGGMGVVYLAEQEKPFRRLVALKLIKPGMDTRQVVARFETERQALALMDHPNIAAVFDAGSTNDGRPYFVMEFVEGVTITEYCDRGRLSTRDRLALFVQVCAAVQHAHQKGVIHRDLKPSNVIVAERDGHALPKVIDFGTAKAIGGDWNATATEGGQGMVLGTLEYMSPEQAALSADIDTATDVYSLGVLLYELLVGRLPFDTDELRAAGYDEIRRVIRESDPRSRASALTSGATNQDLPPEHGRPTRQGSRASSGATSTGSRSRPSKRIARDGTRRLRRSRPTSGAFSAISLWKRGRRRPPIAFASSRGGIAVRWPRQCRWSSCSSRVWRPADGNTFALRTRASKRIVSAPRQSPSALAPIRHARPPRARQPRPTSRRSTPNDSV